MNRLLILYPSLFACQSKFERKLNTLLARLDRFEVVYRDDPHGFIAAWFSGETRVTSVRQIERLDDAGITHAVVFDDGEEFEAERAWFKTDGVALRGVRVALTRVINLKREPEYQDLRSTDRYEYIGRGSYWGNPHSMHEEGESRDEVIRKYQYDFEFDKFLNIDPRRVHELTGKRLGCFCKPARCHGDVLADFLNAYDDGR